MKLNPRLRTIATILAILFPTVETAWAYECVNAKGKFSDCQIFTNDGNLVITYNKGKDQLLNKTIPGDKITHLSGGEYARRRVGESVGLAFVNPAFLFMLFSKKKRDAFGVEYLDQNDHPNGIVVQSKKKYSMALQNALQSASGKKIEWNAPEGSTAQAKK